MHNATVVEHTLTPSLAAHSITLILHSPSRCIYMYPQYTAHVAQGRAEERCESARRRADALSSRLEQVRLSSMRAKWWHSVSIHHAPVSPPV